MSSDLLAKFDELVKRTREAIGCNFKAILIAIKYLICFV